MANLFDPEFDAEPDEPGFRWRWAGLGASGGGGAPVVIAMRGAGKVQARENPPGAPEPGLWQVFRSSDAVGYLEDEPRPDA